MNRTDKVQLFSLLLLSGVWTVICTPVLTGTGEMLGAVLAAGLAWLLCLPFLRRDAPELSAVLHRHRWLGYVYAAYFLLWGAFGFSQLYAAAPRGLIEMPGTGTAAVLLLLTCLYTSTTGLRSAARAAPFLAVVLLLSTIVLTCGAWERAIPDRLQLRTEGIFSGALHYLAGSGELAAAWVLLGRTKHGQAAVHAYLPARLGFFLLLFSLSIMTGGRLTAAQQYPFLTLTSLAQPLEGQRVDALYLLAFVMLFVMHITLLTGLTAHLLTLLHPALERTAPLALPVMLGISRLVPGETLQMTAAAAMPVLVCAVPLAARIHTGRRAEA